MQFKKIQFIPGAVDAMREYAAAQYDKILECDYSEVDYDVVDDVVEQCVPQRIRCAVANDAGEAIWGLHPIIASNRVTESMLMDMIARLDAIVEWVTEGNEFDYYCRYDSTTRAIRYEGDAEDWYSDGEGNIVYVSE